MMNRVFHHSPVSRQGKRSCDFLVMGGGPVGSSVAYHLAKNGAKNIVVLERDFCYRTTSAMLSAGGIRQQFSVPENIKMSMYGAQFLKNKAELAVNGEVPDLQFHENGYLFLAGNKSRHILETNHTTQQQCGANWIEKLEQDALMKQFPWMNIEGIDVGTFGTQNEGYFDPWLFVGALKKKAIDLGVTFIEGNVVGAKLESVSTCSSSYNVNTITYVPAKSKQIEEIHANKIANCAGAWSGRLVDSFANSLTKPQTIHKVPVAPRKRCIFSVHCPGLLKTTHPVPPANTPLVVDPSGVYFRAESKQGSFIMGVSPTEQDDHDVETSQEDNALRGADQQLFEDVVWPTLAERVPAFEELKMTSSWAGFYDYNSVDQNAIIGFHADIRNMVLCTGFSGHGLQQAPAAGRAAAELLQHGQFQTLDVSRFSFERIVDNKPIFETGIV